MRIGAETGGGGTLGWTTGRDGQSVRPSGHLHAGLQVTRCGGATQAQRTNSAMAAEQAGCPPPARQGAWSGQIGRKGQPQTQRQDHPPRPGGAGQLPGQGGENGLESDGNSPLVRLKLSPRMPEQLRKASAAPVPLRASTPCHRPLHAGPLNPCPLTIVGSGAVLFLAARPCSRRPLPTPATPSDPTGAQYAAGIADPQRRREASPCLAPGWRQGRTHPAAPSCWLVQASRETLGGTGAQTRRSGRHGTWARPCEAELLLASAAAAVHVGSGHRRMRSMALARQEPSRRGAAAATHSRPSRRLQPPPVEAGPSPDALLEGALHLARFGARRWPESGRQDRRGPARLQAA